MNPSKPHIAFIGMAGVGKSAIARRIAHRLGCPSVDIDSEVVSGAGCSIAEIFSDFGEPAFRDLETEALDECAASESMMVIATGGGIVDRVANHEILRSRSRVVWLHAPDEVLVERLTKSATKRPLLKGDLRANLTSLRERRDPLYESLAEISIEVGGLDLTGTTSAVFDAMSAQWPDIAVAQS